LLRDAIAGGARSPIAGPSKTTPSALTMAQPRQRSWIGGQVRQGEALGRRRRREGREVAVAGEHATELERAQRGQGGPRREPVHHRMPT
jgi:hypothetical protein